MSIKFACACGKMLTVPDDASGRRARCPACNAVVMVPGTPPPPPPPPPEERPSTKVDQMMETFSADLARSRERAPQLTEIAVALLIWSGVSLVLTFLGSVLSETLFLHSLVLWVTIYAPMSAAGALLALGIIKAWRWTPSGVTAVAPVLVGANYVLFWLWAGDVAGWGALFFLVSIINLGGFGFLYWYFRWQGGSDIFAQDETPAPETVKNTSKPAEGTQAK